MTTIEAIEVLTAPPSPEETTAFRERLLGRAVPYLDSAIRCALLEFLRGRIAAARALQPLAPVQPITTPVAQIAAIWPLSDENLRP
jgi:hypothetical protein